MSQCLSCLDTRVVYDPNLFANVACGSCKTPRVSILLPHQLDCNRPYLDLALSALARSKYRDFELLLISGAESPPPDLMGRVHWDRSLNTATKKVQWGLDHARGDFILLHSDDVVLSRESLGEMVSASENHDVIMNPFSNSDCRSLYLADFNVSRGQEQKRLIHDMSIEDVAGWENEILSFPLGRRILFPVPSLSFYCTMLRRKTWDRIGELDPALEYRHNDQDFCMRARQIGVASVVNLAPFAFHFGSRTLRHLASDETKAKATAHFMEKYGLTV